MSNRDQSAVVFGSCETRLIVLTTYDGDEDIYRSLRAGAKGYLLKDVFFEELETAIRTAHAGSRRIPAAIGLPRGWPALI